MPESKLKNLCQAVCRHMIRDKIMLTFGWKQRLMVGFPLGRDKRPLAIAFIAVLLNDGLLGSQK